MLALTVLKILLIAIRAKFRLYPFSEAKSVCKIPLPRP
jgi:hypothetical protein